MTKLHQKNNNIKLTRYLYIYDEVKYSLLTSLTLKTSFDEVLFWLSELYESGFTEELWQFTYSIYYNFYSILYPKLLSYIIKQNSKWETSNDYSILIKCYKNMFHKTVDTKMFYIYILSNKYLKNPEGKENIVVFKGRSPTICKLFQSKYKHFIQSLEKQNLNNISYYTALYDDSEFIDVLKKYIEHKGGQYIENSYYENRKINVLFHYFTSTDKSKKIIYVSESKIDIQKYNKTKEHTESIYKTLENQMLYPIRNEVSQFELSRDNISFESLQELYWYKWEVLCYDTPYWKHIFNKYNIQIDKDKKTLIYPSDDVYNKFWDNYNYDFDEQKKDIQMKFLKPLDFCKNTIFKTKIIY